MSLATEGSREAAFDAPYIDIDEWREEPIRHRYVHGGFEGTDTRFSMHFPPAERYQGRFFQPLMPVSGSEHAAATGVLTGMAGIGGHVGFAGSNGAILVESNLGRTDPFPGNDPGLTMWKASAATARYCRVLAAEMYGDHRAYGYVFGGSGGAFKTISCVEHEIGLWDGALPYVHAHPMALPNVFTIQSHAMRILWDKFPQIVDAIEPGGSGDMYAGLTTEERQALGEITSFGMPPRAWFDVERIAAGYTGVWSMIISIVHNHDPQYFEEFWTTPGYLGADPNSTLHNARVQHTTTVKRVINREEGDAMGLVLPLALRVSYPDMPVALQVEALPEKSLRGAAVHLTSGEATGRMLYVTEVHGDVLTLGFSEAHAAGLTGIVAGDELRIDNSIYLAAQTYHRHQVHPALSQWDQYRSGGEPIYPQRPLIGAREQRMTGTWAGKMIVVQTMMDEAAHPVMAHYYRQLVEQQLGTDLDDRYRIWYVDHALHTTPIDAPDDPPPVRTTRVVSYVPVLHQGLLDLANWVENDVAPPPSTNYRVVDNQVFLPASAKERGGIQPVVTLTANGSARADVKVGESVTFVGVAEAPPRTGAIVLAEWDFDGTGQFAEKEKVRGGDGLLSEVMVTTTHTFTEPGTYFPALRITSHRQGDSKAIFGRITNLGRVRVVVS
jgi:hypothetical protein